MYLFFRNSAVTKSSPNSTKPAKKSPFAGLVCVTTDENGHSKTERVTSPKTSVKPKTLEEDKTKDKDKSPQEKFKQNLGKTTL